MTHVSYARCLHNHKIILVWNDRLDIRQARLNIVTEKLTTTIHQLLLDNLDHTPALKRDLLLSPTEQLEHSLHTERIIIPYCDAPRQHNGSPVTKVRAAHERVV